jgi:hypothetical protein
MRAQLGKLIIWFQTPAVLVIQGPWTSYITSTIPLPPPLVSTLWNVGKNGVDLTEPW